MTWRRAVCLAVVASTLGAIVVAPCALARSLCHKPASRACCCPPGAQQGAGCRMDCHEDPAPVSVAPAAPVSTLLSNAVPSGEAVVTTILLDTVAAATVASSLHAPPLERYLLACVLRL